MSGDETAVPTTPAAPFLRVVTPGTTPEEVAAVVAVLASLGGAPAPAPRRTSTWAAPARAQRTPHHPGHGAWRASGLPR